MLKRNRRLVWHSWLLLVLALSLITTVTPTTAAPVLPPVTTSNPTRDTLTPGPIVFPDNFMTSIKTYGATGDGVTDDTAAIQAALNDQRVDSSGNPLYDDYYGRPKMLYFPAGTYLVSNTVSWIGCCMLLQGQGSGVSVIKLKNNATGFNDTSNPKPVISMPNGNMSFRQDLRDLAINTGSGNAGAVGLDYISNNVGSLLNIAITSGDGAGARGLDMTRSWPGPLLVKNLRVTGFEYGIKIQHAEYGPTFENIYLSGQSVAGIYNDGNTLAIRGLTSTNSVPAIKNIASYGSIVLLDGLLTGGASGNSAIENGGYLYVRNVSSTGYQSAIKNGATVVPGSSVTEYVSGTTYGLFGTPQPHSLNLPIQDTPTYNDTDMTQWGKFTPTYYGDTASLQALLNSGKSTIYFPAGVYFSYNERAVTVPASVKRIIGFSSFINGDSNGTNGGRIRLIVEDNSSDPLVIEQFHGLKIDHRSARPVVMKNGNFDYTSVPGAGDVFLEDVGTPTFKMYASQRVWARQYNNESNRNVSKITNEGGKLWILGLKTEQPGTVITTEGGGSTELLGTLIYPADAFSTAEKQRAAFVARNSRMSLIYSVSSYCTGCNYDIQVEETQGADTRKLLTSQFPGRMPLYVSKQDLNGYFHPLPPFRLYDTRPSQGGPGAMTAGQTRTLTAVNNAGLGSPGSTAKVPASAKAVLANLTAVNVSKGGFLTAYQTGTTLPTISSLNWFRAGQSVANSAAINLNAAGQFDLYAGAATTEVVVDIIGYMDDVATGPTVPPSNPMSGLISTAAQTYHPVSSSVTSVRAYDSRTSAGGPGPLATGQSRLIPITGRAGVPAGAKAVAINLTAINANNGGFLAAYPGPTNPGTANLVFNSSIQRTVGNATVATLDASGKLTVLCGGTNAGADFVIDVLGYYDATSLAQGGYVPIAPLRLYDSRTSAGGVGPLATGQERVYAANLTPASLATGVPSNARAVVIHLTAVNTVAGGFLALYGQTYQSTSSLNWDANGQIISNLAVVSLEGLNTLKIRAGGGASSHSDYILDVVGYVA